MKLTNTLADLLSDSLYQGDVYRNLDRSLIEFLLSHNCNYYEILKLLSTIMPENCPEEDVETLQSLAPPGKPLKNLKPSSIRSMIPRWTGTKYHTAPISKVIIDIQQKCNARETGIFTYHSNLNPRNKWSVDDPYVLMITKEKITFLDINRTQTYTHIYSVGE